MDNSPIGVFDSGVGGLSLLQEIKALLPNEDFVYIADNAYSPYGAMTSSQILDRSKLLTKWLIAQSCKIIVVACNTATTNAISILREENNLSFVGIEPAIKPAALQTKTSVVGVLATKGTLSSSLFHETSNAYGQGITIVEKEGKHLVQMIEQGKINNRELRLLLHSYIKPMIDQGADHLVLGCTHYPFLTPVLKEILPDHVKIVDCSKAVAQQVERILKKKALLRPEGFDGETTYYCTGESNTMQSFVGHGNAIKKVSILG